MIKKNVFILTPNQITFIRIIIFLVGTIVIFTKDFFWIGFACYVVGGTTDKLDGYIARKYGLVSRFGEVFDEMADKIASLIVLTGLVNYGIVPVIFMSLILFRDFIMIALRNYLSQVYQVTTPSNWFGKRKLEAHFIALIIFLISFQFSFHFELVKVMTGIVSLIFSYASLISYFFILGSKNLNSKK